jgi:glutathione synthase/RimK-type ligase-like ATP-grasp enzyme
MILLTADHSSVETTPKRLLQRLREAGADACLIDTDLIRTGAAHLTLRWEANGELSGGLTVEGRFVPWQEVRAAWVWRAWFGQTVNADRELMDPEALKFLIREWRKFYQGLTLMLSRAGTFCINPMPMSTASEEKVWQFELARRLGFRVPDTLITTELEAARTFYAGHQEDIIYKTFSMPAITLPRGERGQERVGMIYTSRVKPEHLVDRDTLTASPMLFQERIAKQFEIRATIVGDRVFAAAIDATASPKANLDWRRYDNENTRYRPFALPPDIEAKLITLLQELGLRYGAADLIVTPDGEYVFLEVNPNGQYLWVEDFAGLPITAALAELLIKADQAGRREEDRNALRHA